MNRYEWVIEEVFWATIKTRPPEPPSTWKYINRFLHEVWKEGDTLTRKRFWKILKECQPSREETDNYLDYNQLSNHFSLVSNFSKAWPESDSIPLQSLTASVNCGRMKLPKEFCKFGGEPDWIQDEKVPVCPSCDGDMAMLLQLKSLPRTVTEREPSLAAYTFGDSGNFYVFCCPSCGEYDTAWDCY